MSNTILFSKILNSNNLELLLLCFFNLNVEYNSTDEVVQSFTIGGSFKQSKYTSMRYDKKKLFSDVASNLSRYYQITFVAENNAYKCIVKNDLNYSYRNIIDSLRNKILVQISRFPYSINIDPIIAQSIYILRGSPDFVRNLIAVDVLRSNDNDIYIDSMFRIINVTNELFGYLNWNFRELQHEYITGKNKRNTQLRLNLKWFYENVQDFLKQINQYKYQILMENEALIGNLDEKAKISENFIKRVQFYRSKILNNSLSEMDIKEIRNDLFGEKNVIPTRSQRIVSTVKNLTPDICCACHKKYSISDRSFIVPKDDRYYFEYHHVIPFSSNRSMLDIVENVVKLCPTCHRAMTKNRATNNLQIELICNILETRDDVLGFTKSFYQEADKYRTACRIQNNLV